MKNTWLLLLLLIGCVSVKANELPVEDSTIISLDDSSMQELLTYLVEADSINNTFTYDTAGTIILGDGLATLTIPAGFKYVSGPQADDVMHRIWGNPPSTGSLGMLFTSDCGPANYSCWAVDISFVEEGYVSDEEASELDFDELEQEMLSSAKEESDNREAAGYGKLEFLGWAKDPYYDSANKKLHWALKFDVGSDEYYTLNYNIRMLGRRGYLMLNIIGTTDQLEEIEPHIDALLSSVNFNEGHTYADFDPEYDKVAAYGIGALVAGKVLSKAGLWVVLAKFWKFIALGVVAAGAAVKKFFFGGASNA